VKKNFEDLYNRLNPIPACGRQTDGQASCHGIVSAMHMRRAVKMNSLSSEDLITLL